jgi:hypothetical protein
MSDLIGRLWELAEDVEMALSQAGAEIPYLSRQLAETRAHLAEANAALSASGRLAGLGEDDPAYSEPDPIKAAILAWWGERCQAGDFEPECSTCRAWEAFDRMSRREHRKRPWTEQKDAVQ